MKRKKILIVGPIGDKGGREIEAGYIAKVLSNNHLVKILSTSYITSNSQVTLFFPWENIKSVNGILFKTYWGYKILAYLAWLKNLTRENPVYFVANQLAKRYWYYKKSVSTIFEIQIREHDLIIFLGQFSSNYVEEIISKTYEQKKIFFFRTTGKVSEDLVIQPQLKYTDLFIFHSAQNLTTELKNLKIKYELIDQTALNEVALTKIDILNKKIHKFLIVGDVSSHKGVDIILKFFSSCSNYDDQILILGDGTIKKRLIHKYRDNKNVQFAGFVEHDKLPLYLAQADCLIIGSLSETGPYVGLEAMAAGRLILSTKIGAMEKRLLGTGNEFWFSRDKFETFQSEFRKIKDLDAKLVKKISSQNREQYLEKFSNSVIAKRYNYIVEKYTSCGKE